MKERVVITGLGTVNPSGNNVNQYWKNLQIGKNSIKHISLFDTTTFKVKIAGECSIDLNDYFLFVEHAGGFPPGANQRKH